MVLLMEFQGVFPWLVVGGLLWSVRARLVSMESRVASLRVEAQQRHDARARAEQIIRQCPNLSFGRHLRALLAV